MSTLTRVMIIEDDIAIAQLHHRYLEQMGGFDVVGIATTQAEAEMQLELLKPQLVLLDVYLPDGTGLNILNQLRGENLGCDVILITAARDVETLQTAMRGGVVDYLLKPISMDRFMKAVNKVTEKNDTSHDAEVEDDYFFVKADKKLIRVNFEDIIYIEGLKDYVIIRQDTGRIITLQTMKSLEAKLPEAKFKRIHRSYIVNLDQIEAIVGNMLEVIEKGQAKHIPIGKNYRDDLLKIINDKRL